MKFGGHSFRDLMSARPLALVVIETSGENECRRAFCPGRACVNSRGREPTEPSFARAKTPSGATRLVIYRPAGA